MEEAAPVETAAAEVTPIEILTGAEWGEPLPFPVDFSDGFSDFGPEDVLEEPSAEIANLVMEAPATVASDPVPVPAPVTESPEPRSFPWYMLPPLAWLAGAALLAFPPLPGTPPTRGAGEPRQTGTPVGPRRSGPGGGGDRLPAAG